MKRIIFDTSVYGELVIEPSLVEKLTKLHASEEFVYYGNKIIRDELRKTPTGMKLGDKELRIMLLNLYDVFITKENHVLEITELVELIANKYFSEYQKLKGGYGREAIINDFLIVACASLHNLDILVSNDEKSMLGDKAVKAYRKVNENFQLNNPFFIHYKVFKKEVQTSL